MQQGSVTLTVQHRNSPEWLELCIDLWSFQDPGFSRYLIVDTASNTNSSFDMLTALAKRPDTDVADIGYTAFRHPSDMISDALDYAFAVVDTEYLFTTHTDVFPRRCDVLSLLLSKCGDATPIVGWEMSPRGLSGKNGQLVGPNVAEGVPGHACSLFHLPTMRKFGISWSIRKAHVLFGEPRRSRAGYLSWPDTETCVGLMMKQHKLPAHWFGQEINFTNQVTDFWEHARSMTPRPETRRSSIQARHADAFRRFSKQRVAWFQGHFE